MLYTKYTISDQESLSVNLGTYGTSPLFSIAHISQGAPPEESVWISQPTIVYNSAAKLYFHWLLDDLFGLWWLVDHFQLTHAQKNILLFETYLKEGYQEMLDQIFVDSKVESMNDFIQREQGSTKEAHICFEKLYVGPSGHHVGGKY
jgi:hypothetical protein